MAPSSGAKGKKSRGDRIRTCDHLHPIQVRYQTALLPERNRIISNPVPAFKAAGRSLLPPLFLVAISGGVL